MTGRRLGDRVRAAVVHPAVADSLRLQIGQAATIGLQAVTSLVLLRVLGPELVGVYAISAALAATIALVDVSGASRVALVDLARARGADAPGRMAGILARFLRVSVLVRIPIVAAFFVIAPRLGAVAYGREDVGVWARWLAVPLAVDVLFDLLTVLLQGRAEMGRLVRAETGRVLVTAIGTVVVLLVGLGIPGICLVQAGVSVAAAIWAWRTYDAIARREATLPRWGELTRLARRAAIRPRLAAGFSMALEKNVGNFGGQLPMLVVGILRPDAVGYYSAALRTMSLPYPLVSAFARHLDVLLPESSGEGLLQMRRTLVRATLLAASIWAAVTLVMVSIGPFLLVRLAGADYTPAIPALYPLVVQSLATGAGVGIGASLRALDKPSHGIALQVISIIATAPLGMALTARQGAVGAAWFHALRYGVLTAAGLGWVFWLVRSPGRRGSPVVD